MIVFYFHLPSKSALPSPQLAGGRRGGSEECPLHKLAKAAAQRAALRRAEHGFDGVGDLCRAHRAAPSGEARGRTAWVSEPGARVSATSRDPFKHSIRKGKVETHRLDEKLRRVKHRAGGPKSSWCIFGISLFNFWNQERSASAPTHPFTSHITHHSFTPMPQAPF